MKRTDDIKNVVIVSHKVVHQPDDDLVIYFNNKSADNVLHITHGFANAKDRKSKYRWFRKGKLYRSYQTWDYRLLPEPFLYLKEFYFTLLWIFQSKIIFDIYVGLDGLCILFGMCARYVARVKKTIFWAIDFVPENRFKSGLKNTIYNWINKTSYLGTDEMWDLSPRMAEGRKKFLGIGLSDYKKHKVTPYGLWTERIRQVPYRECRKNTMVFLGNLSKYQGLQLVIKVLPKLVKKNPEIRLDIIGEGEYTPEVKKLARQMKVDKYCNFIGRMENAEQMEIEIAKSAIALAPYLQKMNYISRYTDLGKIKTYIACGVPILTTDVPWNAKEIERRKCGIIIKESNEDLYNKIMYLLDGSRNDAYRRNAITYAKTFNFKNIFDEALSSSS